MLPQDVARFLNDHGFALADDFHGRVNEPPWQLRATLIGVTASTGTAIRPCVCITEAAHDDLDWEVGTYPDQTLSHVLPAEIGSLSVRSALSRFVRRYRLQIAPPDRPSARAADEPAYFISSTALWIWSVSPPRRAESSSWDH